MEKLFDIVITTVFGLESVVKKECEKLGFDNLIVQNGKIEFKGSQRDIVIANLWLRSAERVFIKLIEIDALSYDDIYDNVKAFNWEDYLSEDGKYIVQGKSQKSKMHSISDNQSITKKAIIDRLQKTYNKKWFDETKEEYKIHINIFSDKATVLLDTSGTGLHKRGYRTSQNQAPIKETLAAALVQLSNWDGDTPFVDLFCGSGTIPIEAALIAKNIAPGISRDFDFNYWKFIDKNIYKEEKVKAYKAINDKKLDIMGFDIDYNTVQIAISNAINAGVDEDIKFVTKDVAKVGLKNNFGTIISNPPYGERMGDEDTLNHIYKTLSILHKKLTTWSFYYVTADKSFEINIDALSDRKRKLYNGRIEVDYYQYYGPNLLI